MTALEMRRPELTATYRLQLRREFPLAAARELVPYFHELGISHLYLSPLLAARPGSPHGYDVIDPARVNSQLGTEDDLRALAADVHQRGMGLILDIVPNHMAASEANPYWDDVLARGQASRYASWFDIDWDAPRAEGRVVLPVLGDALENVLARGEITLRIRDSGSRIEYFGKTFPIDGATLPQEIQLAQLDPAARPLAENWLGGSEGITRLHALLLEQHFRLAFWRQSTGVVNYRRFFDVNDLVALRMDSDAVFDATHALVLSWVRDGVVDGLRVDHVDGLPSPRWYLDRLRRAVSPGVLIFVEKILSGDERLPEDWPVDGTTGYEFLNDVEELFLDEAGFAQIEANYRGLRHNPSLRFSAAAQDGKRRALTGSLCPDVQRVARLAHAWRPSVSEGEFATAIVGFLVCLDVYRTYVDTPGVVREADRAALDRAFAGARTRDDVNQLALDVLRDAFVATPDGDASRAELVARLQQLGPPATAKGVEDTALYVYIPLASRNEVGGKPDRPLAEAAARVHAHNAERATRMPQSMVATNTHDTKRSADVRARLDALTWDADLWARYTARWRRLNRPRKRIARGRPAPDTNSEYLFYQMLAGVWPAPRAERRVDDLPDREWIERVRERLVTYMLKAAREAKTRTSWTDADTQYEKALEAFVRETLNADDPHFLPDVARLTAQIGDAGLRISLARVLLQCTAPGTPDLYQGDEIWNFTLVDPDNRRPVDFERLQRLLGEQGTTGALRAAFDHGRFTEGAVKLALIARLLRFRREHCSLFTQGDYFPLSTGTLFSFARRTEREVCISVTRTRSIGNTAPAPADIVLPDAYAGRWESVLTGRVVTLARSGGPLQVGESELIAAGHPCELLFRAGV
jgi:(1->4)-alpha-D-glucan 1-alpha-D-glucosylmutase